MSDTPRLADECKKLLDNGWTVQIFRNDLGSYTAVALSGRARGLFQAALDQQTMDLDDEEAEEIATVFQKERCITDDFEPSQALYRLTEKVFGRIV